MMIKASAIAAVALAALAVGTAKAVEITGYTKIAVPANSDVLLTVPFDQDASGDFAVNTKTGTGVTVTNTLTTNQFATTFFIRFTSGTGKGLWTTISSNTTSAFVFANTAILSDINVGDTFTVYPHRTLTNVFTDGMAGLSYAKTTSLANRQTEVLIPDTTGVGTNRPISATYFYFNNAWRKVGAAPTVNFNNTVLPPQDHFILRNRTANPLTYISMGDVTAVQRARYIPTETIKTDVVAAAGFPLKIKLAQLGLGGTSAFATTTNVAVRKDELLVFDNTAVGQNKPALATFFFFNNAWRKVGDSPATSHNDDLLDVGAAFVVRKAAGASAATTKWTEPLPGYLQ